MRRLFLVVLLLLVVGVVGGLVIGRARHEQPQTLTRSTQSAVIKTNSGVLSGPKSGEGNVVSDNHASKVSVSPKDAETAPQPSVEAESALPLQLTDQQQAQLHEMTKYADLLAQTYSPSDYTPPEVPPDLAAKLTEISPELLTLVKIATRIPPRPIATTQTAQ